MGETGADREWNGLSTQPLAQPSAVLSGRERERKIRIQARNEANLNAPNEPNASRRTKPMDFGSDRFAFAERL